MTPMTQQLESVTNKIVRTYRPDKIILFGSYAWGTPTDDSDVDLFVIQQSEKPRLERQREIRRALFPPPLPIDLLVYTPQEVERRLALGDFFIEDIINKGKVLYAAS